MKKIINKAQIFSIDAIIAIVSFLVILISAVWIWDYTKEKIELNERRNDLELISMNALAVLVETPGDPANWTGIQDDDFNQTNVLSLGLARSYSASNVDVARKGKSAGLSINNYLVMDIAKIQRLYDSNAQKYEMYKKILGILGPAYEFQLLINRWDGNNYVTEYEIGAAPNSTAANIVRADRYALLDNNRVNVVFKVWQQCSDVTC